MGAGGADAKGGAGADVLPLLSGLIDVANKHTGCAVKFEFHINKE